MISDEEEISVSIDVIEQVARQSDDKITLPRRHVLYLIKRVRQAEMETAVACAQTVKMCADCVSAFCDSEKSIDDLMENTMKQEH